MQLTGALVENSEVDDVRLLFNYWQVSSVTTGYKYVDA